MQYKFCVVAAVNDEFTLRAALLASPELKSGKIEFHAKKGFSSASIAYNSAMDTVAADIYVFAHQDIYLPQGWFANLERAVMQIEDSDPDWGVLGVYGVCSDGQPRGCVYSTGLGRIVGAQLRTPKVVRTLDEVILIIKGDGMLLFDEGVAGFHLYGTDICLTAEAMGRQNYVIDAFALHNSNGVGLLPWSFWVAYAFVRCKWWTKLPIVSPCIVVSKSPWPFLRSTSVRLWNHVVRRKSTRKRVPDPSALYQSLFGDRLRTRAKFE